MQNHNINFILWMLGRTETKVQVSPFLVPCGFPHVCAPGSECPAFESGLRAFCLTVRTPDG